MGATVDRDLRLRNRSSHAPILLSEVAPDDPRVPELQRGWYFCRHCGVRGEDTYDAPCSKVQVVTPAEAAMPAGVTAAAGGAPAIATPVVDLFDPFATPANRPGIEAAAIATPAKAEAPAHARLGPSDGDRWWNCPGAINASKGMKRSTSSYAEAGTAAHWVGETALLSGQDAAEFIGKKAPNGIEIDRDTATAVQVYLDEVRRQAGELFADIVPEGRADLTHIDPDLYGTYDSRLVVPGEVAHVNDYKNGAKTVEASALQLKLYALDALQFDVQEVVTTVVQPNAQHDEGPVRSHRYTAQELRDWIPEVKAHAAATRDPDAPRNAGAWCHYCPAAPTCPALQQRALSTAQAEFGATPPKPAEMTPEAIAQVLKLWPMVEAWGNAVHSYARQLVQTGVAIPGWKLVNGKLGNRQWRDELLAADAIQAAGKDPWAPAAIISPAQAEKALGKKAFAALSTLTYRAPGGIALVPEDDKRPAIAAGPASDFDDVTHLNHQE